jgi:heme o synthase
MIRSTADSGMPCRENGSRSALPALLQLAKPGIVASATLTGYAGMVLAGPGLPSPGIAWPCCASLALMASGAALVNNVLDRDLDRHMARLNRRRYALQQLGVARVLAMASGISTAALLIAGIWLPPFVPALLSIASLSYLLLYTKLLKPNTPWAAILGALPGALPAMIGSASLGPPTHPGALVLFLILMMWQPPHFWLLALTRLDDYRAARIPVLPLSCGIPATKRCICWSAASLAPAGALLWSIGPCSAGLASWAVLLSLGFLAVCQISLKDVSNAPMAFRASILYLLMLEAGIIIDLIH